MSESKIIDINEAAPLVNAILTYGHFNTIHPGHIRYLKHAKAKGSILVVAIIGDLEAANRFRQSERAESVASLDIVDLVVKLRSNEFNEAIERIKPVSVILGQEDADDDQKVNLKVIADSLGIQIEYHAGDIHYASSDLLDSTEQVLKARRVKAFKAACKRQGVDLSLLSNHISSFSRSNIVVVGDTIVDEYAACEPIGISAEAPVVVVKELEKKVFIGGAAIVASHVAALGASCSIISVVGNDPEGEYVEAKLAQAHVNTAFVRDCRRPTTLKKRYIVENQKLFRVSRLEDKFVSPDIEEKVITKLEHHIPSSDGLIVSDFVYGVITDNILQKINQLALKHNIMLFGDLQCSSQVGNVMRFKDFSLLSPNEREARFALQNKDAGLEELSQRVLAETRAKRLIMKLGGEGFIAYDHDMSGNIFNESFPALSVNPVDVAGAGDSLLALLALALSSGLSMMQSSALGCIMSYLSVETMGNVPISSTRLRQALTEISGFDS